MLSSNRDWAPSLTLIAAIRLPTLSSFKLLFHLAEGGRTIREAFPNKEEGEEEGVSGEERRMGRPDSAGPSITISKINKTCGES